MSTGIYPLGWDDSIYVSLIVSFSIFLKEFYNYFAIQTVNQDMSQKQYVFFAIFRYLGHSLEFENTKLCNNKCHTVVIQNKCSDNGSQAMTDQHFRGLKLSFTSFFLYVSFYQLHR